MTSGELGLKLLPADRAQAAREAECRAAAAVLGCLPPVFFRCPDYALADHIPHAAGLLAELFSSARPAQIYLPHPLDDHPDHAACLPIARAANAKSKTPIDWTLGYEIWRPMPEHDHLQDITDVMPLKQEAVACYPSQLQSFRYDRAVAGLAAYRGALAGHCDFAEVFCTLDLD